MSKSSGNVFKDLGFSGAEAENLKIRSELMIQIIKYVKNHKLTQIKAAERLGIDQPRINKLLNGHVELFTIDKLVTMLVNINIKVKLKIAA